MVLFLVIVIGVGLIVGVLELVRLRRREMPDDTRAQLDALKRVVDPQRRADPSGESPVDDDGSPHA